MALILQIIVLSAMMTGINRDKNGNGRYEGELLVGTPSDKGEVFPAYYVPAFFCSRRFPQAHAIVAPMPYLVSFNPDDTAVIKGTPSFENLESLLDAPTSWEDFVSELSELDAQAPTMQLVAQAPTIMPSWDEFLSDFEEMVYKELESNAKDLVEDAAKDLGTSPNKDNDLVGNIKELGNKADDMAAMTMMSHMLSELVNKDTELETKTRTVQPWEESRSSVESTEKELEANVKDREEAAMAMTMLSLTMSATPLSHKGSKDTGLDVSKEKVKLSMDRQQIDTYTKEPDEIVHGSNEESDNKESLSVIRKGDLCSGRFGQCVNLAVKGGRCLKCTRKYTCSNDDCANKRVKGGVCIRHGAATPTCSHDGCTNKAKRKGLCLRHGAKLKTCVHEGCTNIARHRGGVCWSHNTTGAILQPFFCMEVLAMEGQGRGEGVCSIP